MKRHSRFLAAWLVAAGVVAGPALAASPGPAAAAAAPVPPPPEDLSAPGLRAYQDALLTAWGGDHRRVPLEAKALHFEWVLWRYHASPWGQIQPTATLPATPGEPVRFEPGADVSTWNGAFLAALSHRYAATRDPETLERIAGLLEGLSRYQEVTGVPGLVARCVLAAEAPVGKVDRPWTAPDGTRFHWRGVPAKGTYNQLAVGYAALAVHAYADLPESAQRRARRDFAALATHLVDGGWRIRGADQGRITRYGNLRPSFLGQGIPFHAQVAWLFAATARRLPPEDPDARARLGAEYQRLRASHPFYESPWLHLVRPQRVGANPLIGANDRQHVVAASFSALALELDAAAREGREPDPELVHQLGRSLYWSARRLPELRNSLANFMWAATVADPDRLRAIVPDRAERARVRRQVATLLDQGVEQLRRFPLDRFIWQGVGIREGGPYWMDEYRPDNYVWKSEPDRAMRVTGPPTRIHRAAIDYLHAYWLLRQAGLDGAPAVTRRHGEVLARRLPASAYPD